ncbi:unnamed protein product, partial [Rotaria magnacalcarata]
IPRVFNARYKPPLPSAALVNLYFSASSIFP